MLTVRCMKYSRFFRNKIVSSRIVQQSTASHAVQPVTQDNQEKDEKQLKTFETITNVSKRIRTKKPNRPPFAKNLFLGNFDCEVLTYPELEKEEVDLLESDSFSLQKVLKQSQMVNCKSLSEKRFRQILSDYKAIGLQAPQLLDARSCNVTESFKFLEVLSMHNLAQSLVTHEQLGVQPLVIFAEDNLKRKYLHPMIKGEFLSAFCLSETDAVDIAAMKTNAVLAPDQKQWILNGEKNWVINGGIAQYYIVVAVTKTTHVRGIANVKFSAFLVDRDSPGIAIIPNNDITDVNVADVSFKDTPVPVENIIGKVDNGEEMLKAILTQYRLSSGPMCISLSKKILNNLTKDILERSNDQNLLYKTDAIREKVSEIICEIYAMESMLYLTTGLIDNYENQDVELESAIVKAYCSEKLLEISSTCLEIIGAPAAAPNHWANEMHREAMRYVTLNESNDILKIILALLGIRHAGMELNETINKIRNPFFYANFYFKRMWTHRKDDSDNPQMNLFLYEHLHPSLSESASVIEYCVQRLRYGTECLLGSYGTEIVSKHMELRRLANCINTIYAMVAIVGRASRSYCIGLQNTDSEMMIADCYCNYGVIRVKENINLILQDNSTNDTSYSSLAKKLFKFKEYYPQHPLKRNF